MINVLSARKHRFLALICLFALPIVVWVFVSAPAKAEDAVKAAMFPFELVIEKQMTDGLAPPSASAEQKRRLALMDAKLQNLLTSSGKYSQVDLSALAEKIEKASPVHDCNGCDIDLAKEAGADVIVLGIVRKASDTLIHVSIFVKDVGSEKIVKAGAVSIREDDDAGWLRAVRSIVRNRILRKAP